MISLAVAAALAASAGGGVYQSTEITRNLDPSWQPGTYREFIRDAPMPVPLEVSIVVASENSSADFVILMEEGLSDTIGTFLLNQWVEDIQLQGLAVEVQELTYSTPTELRQHLQNMHQSGLQGAVLVGQLPVPWSTIDNSFLRYSETFPSDYYYMDLTGVWSDQWIGPPSQGNPGQDGVFDGWSGELEPEIYVSRILTDNLPASGDPAELLRAYLERNHAWKDQGDTFPACGLCYVDDDWASSGPGFQAAMEELYGDVELINEYSATCGTDYEENRLQGNLYTWISPFVHSSSQLHQWSPGPSTYWYEVEEIDPRARFYNLFACSNARFTEENHMGGIYTFGTGFGLSSVGSTKSGSMLSFSQFYEPIGDGGSIGEGYMAWWDYITSNGFTDWEKSWHLGMVLLGDPTLMPSWHQEGVAEPELAAVPGRFLLTASPNPCLESVTFTAPVDASGLLLLFDAAGRVLLEEPFNGPRASLSMRGLPRGVYVARLDAGTLGSASVLLVKAP